MQNINPNLEKELVTFLRNIGIEIESITFVPLGEESFGWKLTTNTQILFLKYCEKKEILKNLSRVNKLLLSLQHLNFVVPPVLIN